IPLPSLGCTVVAQLSHAREVAQGERRAANLRSKELLPGGDALALLPQHTTPALRVDAVTRHGAGVAADSAASSAQGGRAEVVFNTWFGRHTKSRSNYSDEWTDLIRNKRYQKNINKNCKRSPLHLAL
ncbi:MAG: hypothetical protein P4L81_06110, partial [Candidatus Pacebacteria bacterium]|nr:hypothetical protein [Candidatus Paceibacterota bacterium]